MTTALNANVLAPAKRLVVSINRSIAFCSSGGAVGCGSGFTQHVVCGRCSECPATLPTASNNPNIKGRTRFNDLLRAISSSTLKLLQPRKCTDTSDRVLLEA